MGRPRTRNEHEIRVIGELEADGYKVVKRGWPDLIAFNPDTKRVRLIEVKPYGRGFVSPHQFHVAELLALLGVEVEVASGTMSNTSRPILNPNADPIEHKKRAARLHSIRTSGLKTKRQGRLMGHRMILVTETAPAEDGTKR
jgi:hypothetical protein